MEITELLAFALQNKASDLHLTAGNPPILRIDGQLRRLKTNPMEPDEVKAMVLSVMTEEQRTRFEDERELDFTIAFGQSGRFRVNSFNTEAGAAAVMRSIPTHVPSLEDLNAPAIFRQLANLERGLVLVTGPTGSGKSTTLAAMIDYINATSARHVLTIEDPIEFVHTSKTALINHREVGNHTRSFARALKSALREDPDVILVGEMRDRETISLALTAAETGHLVMGTLHTTTAPKTIDRVVDVFPGEDKPMVRTMLAGSVQAIVSQQLLRRTGGGRVAAHEILIATGAVRNLIRENKIPQLYSMMQVGQKFGMQTMRDAVEKLLAQGTVAPEEAARVLASADSSEPTEEAARPDERPHNGTPAAAAKTPPPPPPRRGIQF